MAHQPTLNYVDSSGQVSDMNDAQPKEWPYASPRAVSPAPTAKESHCSETMPAHASPITSPIPAVAAPAAVPPKEPVKKPDPPKDPLPSSSATGVPSKIPDHEVRDATYFRILGCSMLPVCHTAFVRLLFHAIMQY